VTPQEDLQEVNGLTNKGKALAAQQTDLVYVGLFDVVITVVQVRVGNTTIRTTSSKGQQSYIKNVYKDSSNRLVADGGYAKAKTVFEGIAADQRAPIVDLGNGDFNSTLQDGTILSLLKSGDWGRLIVQRVGEPQLRVIVWNPIRELNVRHSNPLGPQFSAIDNNIDRIDRLEVMIENKKASDLLLPQNRYPDGTMRQTEADWAQKHVYRKMHRRLVTVLAATDTFPGPGYVGPGTTLMPTADDVRAVKRVRFEFEGDWDDLRQAVRQALAQLRGDFSGFGYSFEDPWA
jgi:hypothetical protein